MGLKDLLFPSKDKRDEGRLKKLSKKATQKYLVKEERQDAIRGLIEIGSAEACAALLGRFAFTIDNTTVDEVEKTNVYEGLVRIGEAAVAPTISALAQAQSITWIAKTLAALVQRERFVTELIRILGDLDQSYDRGNERRIQFIQHLGEIADAAAVDILLPKLDDFDQQVRFVTIEALERIGDERARKPLLDLVAKDESIRMRTRAIDALSARDWSVADSRDALEGKLPADYFIDANGRIRSRLRAFQEAMQADTRSKKRALKEVHLIQATEEVVPILLAATDDNDPEVRWRAAVHLGKTGDPRALTALESLRNDPVAEVRKRVEEALRRFGEQ